MHRGYIKLWRKLQDSKIWKSEPFSRGQAWIDLIMMANHKDNYIRKRGIRIELTRGQIGWSERELSKRWKWSRGKVRRFLSELCSEKEAKIVPQTVPQNKNVTSCYLIKNYDLYQGGDTLDNTTDGPQTDRKRYQNNNVKNDKNDKTIYTSSFLDFWNAYPRKVGKGDAFRAWKSANGKPEINELIKIIQAHCQSDQWKKDNGQFIPHPGTWLRQRRWEDILEKQYEVQQRPMTEEEKWKIKREQLKKLGK